MNESKPTDLITASSLGPLSQKQESIAEILVQDKHLEKLTELYRDEPLAFSLCSHIFSVISALKNAPDISRVDYPDIDTILSGLFKNRISLDRKGRLELRDVAKIHVVSEESRPMKKGILGWLRHDG